MIPCRIFKWFWILSSAKVSLHVLLITKSTKSTSTSSYLITNSSSSSIPKLFAFCEHGTIKHGTIAQAWSTWWQFRECPLLTNLNIRIKNRRDIFHTCVRSVDQYDLREIKGQCWSVLLYGGECGELRRENKVRLKRDKRTMLICLIVW